MSTPLPPSLFTAVVAAALIGCATPGPWAANQPVNCAVPDVEDSIRGIVVDDGGEPLEHVQVFYPSLGCGTGTDARGRFELPMLDGEMRMELLLYTSRVVRVDELDRGEEVHVFALETSVLSRLRETTDFSNWDERPLAREGAPGVPGCFWVGGGAWGGSMLHLREDGMLVRYLSGDPVEEVPRGEFTWDDPGRPILLGGPPHSWHLASDTVSMSLEWYPDAGRVARLILDGDSGGDSISFEIFRWSWTMARSVERTAAVWVECEGGAGGQGGA